MLAIQILDNASEVAQQSLAQQVIAAIFFLSTVAAALAVLFHRRSPASRVGRWLFRKNITDPLLGVFRREVHHAIAPVVDRIERRVTEMANENRADHLRVGSRIAALEDALRRDPDTRTRIDDD